MNAVQVSTLAVLRRTRELVADERTWTNGALARDAEGGSVCPDSSKATRFCLSGAQERGASDMGAEYDAGWREIDAAAKRLFGRGPVRVGDQLGRLAALQVVDAAIAEVEGRS
jgi:hypothetical protein